jgi:hypothetical protein
LQQWALALRTQLVAHDDLAQQLLAFARQKAGAQHSPAG